MPDPLTPEALASELEEIAGEWRASARKRDVGHHDRDIELAEARGADYVIAAIREKLIPAWAAMAAQMAELQREREQAIAGGWTADATRRVAEISADNAMLRGEAETLAEVREVIGAYENEELNPIAAFGNIVKILRPELDGGRHE
jgi:hypothetical protein